MHLPGTLLNDQFGELSIEEALTRLAEATPTIEAIGVTDYFTTESYRKAAAVLKCGVAPTIQLAFPNVELRLDIPTSSNRSVNIHLLCPPEDVDELDRFIGGLEFSWSERRYRADQDGLVQLGRDYSEDSSLDQLAALKKGVGQFKVSFENLRQHLRTDRWAEKNVLVAVAGGQGDGTSGLRESGGAFDARRQSIERLANVVFSSSPKQVQFWSGQGAQLEHEIVKIYGGLKPCLHGSDAHDASQLGVPAENRFCWLKGDPKFDTLRLACLSPTTRVHIGQEPPESANKFGRIIRLAVPDSEWFVNESVDLNPGLVAIIGARGSGKTALADLVAAGAGSTEPFDNASSFVRRAGRLIDDSLAMVAWSHEEVTTCNLAEGNLAEPFRRPVRYLSQQFVERLCASDGVSDELISEIERVIFEAWPVDRRQGAVTFHELLGIHLASARERQAAELDAVLDLSGRTTEMRMRSKGLKPKRKLLKDRKDRLSKLKNEIEKLTARADKRSADRHGVVSTVLRERQEQFQRLQRRQTALNGLSSAVQTERRANFPRALERLRKDHKPAKLTDAEWESFQIDFKGDVDDLLKRKSKKVDKLLTKLDGLIIDDPKSINLDELSQDELIKRSINELKAEEERLRQLVGLDKDRSKQLKGLREDVGQARVEIKKLKQEIKRIENERPDELVSRRLEHYEAYFEALLEEETELRALYAPLEEVLREFGASVEKLRFVVKRVVDVSTWADQGESLLDLRRDGRFRGEGALARVVQRELLSAWETGDAREAAEAIDAFVNEYSGDLRDQQPMHRESNGALMKWETNISRWLYRTDHIRLRYSLEYDGLSIERLSPGSRGIVLLLLYLAVDQKETDPLIIDQPEENLDPESVYSELVKLFRSASRRRQIIMVTHNANLVVNTDVDQVIVAHCGPLEEGRLPELQYVCGGLEDPDIRNAVCEVLEGGAEAFRQRARRLRVDLSIDEPVPEP